MLAQVTFKFEIGHYNGSMSLKAVVKNQCLFDLAEFDSDNFEFTTCQEWPFKIDFIVGNKQPLDTLLDDQGKICADKFIKLSGLIVDRVPIHELLLRDLCTLTTDSNQLKQNYWGFNGIASICFEHSDTLSWHLHQLVSLSGQTASVSERREIPDRRVFAIKPT